MRQEWPTQEFIVKSNTDMIPEQCAYKWEIFLLWSIQFCNMYFLLGCILLLRKVFCFIFMYMGNFFSTFMSVCYMHAMPVRPEKAVGSPETGVINNCNLLCGYWNQTQGLWKSSQHCFPTEPCLKLLHTLSTERERTLVRNQRPQQGQSVTSRWCGSSLSTTVLKNRYDHLMWAKER